MPVRMSRNKVELSESMIKALEAVRLAIHIFYGQEIRFISTLKVEGLKIRRSPKGRQFRCVRIEGSFWFMHGSELMDLSAECDMSKLGSWRVDESHITVATGPDSDTS